jgi:hypothetical protein
MGENLSWVNYSGSERASQKGVMAVNERSRAGLDAVDDPAEAVRQFVVVLDGHVAHSWTRWGNTKSPT